MNCSRRAKTGCRSLSIDHSLRNGWEYRPRIRTFPEHLVRRTQLLDGMWDFAVDPDNRGLRDQWFQKFPVNHRSLFVPACWNNELDLFHCSEDYQAELLEKALQIFKNDPKVVGTYIWHFADIRDDLRCGKKYFRDRARSFNNKGLLNEYRKPKQAYRTVKRIYDDNRKGED